MILSCYWYYKASFLNYFQQKRSNADFLLRWLLLTNWWNALSNHLLDGDFLSKTFKWVAAFEFSEFRGSVLVQEFVDRKESASDFYLDFVTFNFNVNASGSKFIHTCRLSHEHDFQLGAIRIVIDILCKFLIDITVFYRNVYYDATLQLNDVALESFDLQFSIAKWLQQIKRRLVGLIKLAFECHDIIRRRQDLFRKLLDTTKQGIVLFAQAYSFLRKKLISLVSVLNVIFICLCNIQELTSSSFLRISSDLLSYLRSIALSDYRFSMI